MSTTTTTSLSCAENSLTDFLLVLSLSLAVALYGGVCGDLKQGCPS